MNVMIRQVFVTISCGVSTGTHLVKNSKSQCRTNESQFKGLES